MTQKDEILEMIFGKGKLAKKQMAWDYAEDADTYNLAIYLSCLTNKNILMSLAERLIYVRHDMFSDTEV